MDDEKFLEAFESGSWPLAEWRHREHIKAAYLYLCRHPFAQALDRMRASIKNFNAAHHVPEEPGRGYHETMTCAWMQLVHVALCEYGSAATSDAFFDQNSQLSEKKALRHFYSRARLMDPAAKAHFLEPDLAPLPRHPSAK